MEIPLAVNTRLRVCLSTLRNALRDMLKIHTSKSKSARMWLIPLAHSVSKLRRLGYCKELQITRRGTETKERYASDTNLTCDSRLQAG